MALLTPPQESYLEDQAYKAFQHGRFVMPAEGAVHSHTLMAFPSEAGIDNVEDGDWLEASQAEVVGIANAISQFEPVHLYTRANLIDKAQAMVGPNVQVKQAFIDQLWIRDSGPVYVTDLVDRVPIGVSFNFNYWGNKLPFTSDETVAAQVTKRDGQQMLRSRLTLEGGAVEIDGEGTFLATESSIINDNRNPGMSKSEVEEELKMMLGVSSFIWLPGIRDYDITDYHIDNFARFVRPGVVLLSKPVSTAAAPVIQAYEEARVVLSQSKDAIGRSLTVYDCQEPDPDLLGPPDQHNEVVASYANYLVVNGAVIMPKFGQEECDREAFNLFQRLFPDREVVQVNLNVLPRTGGGIHCSTQQVPLSL